MRGMLLFLILILLPAPATAAAGEQAGEAVYVRGEAWIVRGQQKLPLAAGKPLEAGDVIVTGDGGRARLEMADDSAVYIGANSRVEIETYQTRGREIVSGVFNMLWGKARFLVSKLRGGKSRYEVRTSTAVLGVRGTEFALRVQPPPGVDIRDVLARIGIDDLPPGEVTLLLYSGSVAGTLPDGTEHLVRPGFLAIFHADGRVTERPISREELDRLGDPGIFGTGPTDLPPPPEDDPSLGDVTPPNLPPPPPVIEQTDPRQNLPRNPVLTPGKGGGQLQLLN